MKLVISNSNFRLGDLLINDKDVIEATHVPRKFESRAYVGVGKNKAPSIFIKEKIMDKTESNDSKNHFRTFTLHFETYDDFDYFVEKLVRIRSCGGWAQNKKTLKQTIDTARVKAIQLNRELNRQIKERNAQV